MDVLERAQSWIGEGRKVALATVIETWGSAPQPVGSQLVVDADGNFEGAVSGGCVEGAVITEAQDMIARGDETAWQVGLACGGKIRVLVEAVE
jgi:xanthine/CO dehydrogenase XdhC/CoxF family maturation factor